MVVIVVFVLVVVCSLSWCLSRESLCVVIRSCGCDGVVVMVWLWLKAKALFGRGSWSVGIQRGALCGRYC